MCSSLTTQCTDRHNAPALQLFIITTSAIEPFLSVVFVTNSEMPMLLWPAFGSSTMAYKLRSPNYRNQPALGIMLAVNSCIKKLQPVVHNIFLSKQMNLRLCIIQEQNLLNLWKNCQLKLSYCRQSALKTANIYEFNGS